MSFPDRWRWPPFALLVSAGAAIVSPNVGYALISLAFVWLFITDNRIWPNVPILRDVVSLPITATASADNKVLILSVESKASLRVLAAITEVGGGDVEGDLPIDLKWTGYKTASYDFVAGGNQEIQMGEMIPQSNPLATPGISIKTLRGAAVAIKWPLDAAEKFLNEKRTPILAIRVRFREKRGRWKDYEIAVQHIWTSGREFDLRSSDLLGKNLDTAVTKSFLRVVYCRDIRP